ncbi:hypothetical protein CHARACLAT_032713 [Characodon lateralis]|uniref:Uncharacterized protein n=1 Tax=Characodon lateralis TaxID=208331 RepID=A0ABU7EFC2_9TELE|nr:hypothetical protein [Characodon lateralis]
MSLYLRMLGDTLRTSCIYMVPLMLEKGLCIWDIFPLTNQHVSRYLQCGPYSIWCILSMTCLEEVPYHD